MNEETNVETQEEQKPRDKVQAEADAKNAKVALGTKDTKEALRLVYGILRVLKEAHRNDGKISGADLNLLVGVFPLIGPALEDADQIPAELKDLDTAEVKDLLVYSAAQLSGVVSNADEVLVDKSLKAAIALVDLIGHILKGTK